MRHLTLPSDAEIARLCNGIYAYPGYAPIAWDHFEEPKRDDGICWAIKRVGQIDAIVLRGSVTRQDWFRDLDAVADPFPSTATGIEDFLHYIGFAVEITPARHAFLGQVHPGFLAGIEDAFVAMQPLLGPLVIVAGHSLGAGRAAILTGLMVHAGRAPLACVTFGQPRPGFPQLAKLIADVPQRSYRNGKDVLVDIITEVPVAIGPEDYVHPCTLTDVCEKPGASWKQQWGIFAWHAMPLYLRALERLDGALLSGPEDVALTPDTAAPHLPIH